MSDTSTSKVLLALLAGVGIGSIIGAGAALLLSPNDGETNRKILNEKIQDLAEDIQDKTDHLLDDIKDEIGKISKIEKEIEKEVEKEIEKKA